MYELQANTPLQCGKYRIKKTLGQGSFGITYLASMQVIGDGCDMEIDVALKEFFMQECNTRNPQNTSVTGSQSELFKKYRDKFMTEAKNLEKMSNYGDIVKIYDVFEENNTAYFSMEYVEGYNLDDYIKQRGRLPESEAIECIKSIATALKHLHDNKMLHLDLKPKNIMRRNDGKLYLIDFGLSKQYNDKGEPESSTSIGLGTPGYAPIEQANFKGVFAPTLDIYALGATLYKMLSGVTAPESSDIFNTGFSPLKTKLQNVGVSSNTIGIVEKAMQVKKADRFQSVDELYNAIDKPSDGTIFQDTPQSINDQGKEYYKKQDYKKAFEYFKRAADMNYPPAAYNLGVCFEKGRYVAKSDEYAAKWYKIAADSNFSDARNKYEESISRMNKRKNNGKKVVLSILGALLGIVVIWWIYGYTSAKNDAYKYNEYVREIESVISDLKSNSKPAETLVREYKEANSKLWDLDFLYCEHKFFMNSVYRYNYWDYDSKLSIAYKEFQEQNPPIIIKNIKFRNETNDNKVIDDYGSTLYKSNIKYLCARLEILSLRNDKSITLYYKVYKEGLLASNPKISPSGYTADTDVYLSDNTTEVFGGGWGNDEGTAYNNVSHVRWEIWYNGQKLGEKTIKLY